MAKLLVVDDEPSIVWALARLGRDLGHEVATASSAPGATSPSSRVTSSWDGKGGACLSHAPPYVIPDHRLRKA